MRPNFARLKYSYIAQPAFPNLMGSDGTAKYSFRSKYYSLEHPFNVPENYNPKLEAKYASGLMSGGGKITKLDVAEDGRDIHLWDGMPLQAFFGPENAIRSYLYVTSLTDLKREKERTIEGVKYKVLYHHLVNGNVAGGEGSDFDQRLYIGPDNLIHFYVLEFKLDNKPGVQVMRLDHIKLNVPMKKKNFASIVPK